MHLYAQGVPIKTNPSGKILYLRNCVADFFTKFELMWTRFACVNEPTPAITEAWDTVIRCVCYIVCLCVCVTLRSKSQRGCDVRCMSIWLFRFLVNSATQNVISFQRITVDYCRPNSLFCIYMVRVNIVYGAVMVKQRTRKTFTPTPMCWRSPATQVFMPRSYQVINPIVMATSHHRIRISTINLLSIRMYRRLRTVMMWQNCTLGPCLRNVDNVKPHCVQ